MLLRVMRRREMKGLALHWQLGVRQSLRMTNRASLFSCPDPQAPNAPLGTKFILLSIWFRIMSCRYFWQFTSRKLCTQFFQPPPLRVPTPPPPPSLWLTCGISFSSIFAPFYLWILIRKVIGRFQKRLSRKILYGGYPPGLRGRDFTKILVEIS